MTIATNGGVQIIIDGKLATACAACKEGACCESNGTCNVRPQCQCQGEGQTFEGVGTTCSPNPCDPCAINCGGAGAPRELAVTITGVTFRNDSTYDADDLPFSIPTTFLASRVGQSCTFWRGLFYPSSVFCTPCNGFITTHEFGIAVSDSGSSLVVLIFFSMGAAGQFNLCLGPSNRFEEIRTIATTSPLTAICYLPISGAITSTEPICPLQIVSYTIEYS